MLGTVRSINVPADYAFEDFNDICRYAHEHRLIGAAARRSTTTAT
jgi:hypothetical protein